MTLGCGRHRHCRLRSQLRRADSPTSVPASSTSYWRRAVEDEAIQDEHVFIWKVMIDTIDTDLQGVQCSMPAGNCRGFLRLLVDIEGIDEGYGYDPASGAITDARRLSARGRSPSRSPTACRTDGADFDVTFSHEVLELAGGPPRPRGCVSLAP